MIEVSVGVDQIMTDSQVAFNLYEQTSPSERANFLVKIAEQINARESEIITIASGETNLPEARIKSEIQRTIFQLKSFADLLLQGDWILPAIDRGNASRQPLPKPDLRKTLRATGPVVVFGASNFPLAFSTAGTDTASALAAGCSVVVKGHPGHPATSALVAEAIAKAVSACKMPQQVFQHVDVPGFQIGQSLVRHPFTKAVAFTGSLQGGKALFDLANARSEPIPVYAEMGSINPIFVFPGALDSGDTAGTIASSVLVGAGQFCTNPGLIVALETPRLDTFIARLSSVFSSATPAKMLHEGIAKNFNRNKSRAMAQNGVHCLHGTPDNGEKGICYPGIAVVKFKDFEHNDVLQEEVFGPFTLVVRCQDHSELLQVASMLHGQLTSTVFATQDELKENASLIRQLTQKCGRIIFNGVPTGVEVCKAMHHGGPFPSSTDSKFTSVGTDAIYRFVRPVSFQNFPDHLLPLELQNANPLGILRCVDNEWTRDGISAQN
jgi:2,5-dioxopentanoate dehydrogenase